MNMEMLATVAMGMTAGLPVGITFFRHLSSIAATAIRGVTALERIADRLESAEYVKLREVR